MFEKNNKYLYNNSDYRILGSGNMANKNSRSNRYQKNYRQYSNNHNYKKNNYTNSYYYQSRMKKQEEREFTNTKQQVFNFDEMTFSDELDTSFVDNKHKNKDRIIKDLDQSYEKQKKQDKKIVKKKKINVGRVVFLFLVFMILFTSLGAGISYFFLPEKVEVVTKVKKRVVMDENIVFVGDSITDFYDLEEYYPDYNVVNSGIDGNQTRNILEDIDERIYQYNPSKVFLLIGTNDIGHGVEPYEIVSNIKQILEGIRVNRPYAKLYLESIYPVEEGRSKVGNRTNDVIKEVNQELKKYCEEEDITYIDMYSLLLDPSLEEDTFYEEYTDDGLHPSEEGYQVITSEIMKYLK